MGLVSKLLLVISVILISHSGFSSYEFHQLLKGVPKDQASGLVLALPNDIKYETLTGLGIFVISVFLSFDKLTYYPLEGSKKLLTQGQYLLDIEMSKATNVDNLIGSDPSGPVTYTPNFVDIHEKRKQAKEWSLENEKKKV